MAARSWWYRPRVRPSSATRTRSSATPASTVPRAAASMPPAARASDILDRWEHFLPLFVKVSPHPTAAPAKPQDPRLIEQAALAAVTHEAHAREGAHSR